MKGFSTGTPLDAQIWLIRSAHPQTQLLRQHKRVIAVEQESVDLGLTRGVSRFKPAGRARMVDILKDHVYKSIHMYTAVRGCSFPDPRAIAMGEGVRYLAHLDGSHPMVLKQR